MRARVAHLSDVLVADPLLWHLRARAPVGELRRVGVAPIEEFDWWGRPRVGRGSIVPSSHLRGSPPRALTSHPGSRLILRGENFNCRKRDVHSCDEYIVAHNVLVCNKNAPPILGSTLRSDNAGGSAKLAIVHSVKSRDLGRLIAKAVVFISLMLVAVCDE